MSLPRSSLRGGYTDDPLTGAADQGSPPFAGAALATHAVFSPASSLSANPQSSRSKQRSTILVHQKSPLLLATPPQVTRALAYSHPFLLSLNKTAALLSWTSGDPWESFLLVLGFWAIVLYGDIVIRLIGPVVVVATLILAMYGRRFSPLSSSSSWPEQPAKDSAPTTSAHLASTPATVTDTIGATGAVAGSHSLPLPTGTGNTSVPPRGDLKASVQPDGAQVNSKPQQAGGGGGSGHQRPGSAVEATSTRHQKTLDEMVEALNEFTGRCNVLLQPLLELTDFLSTQRSPTSATTRPALTTLFVRILICTPFWAALTLPPLRVVTTQRVVLLIGTLILTWHSRVMRVTRTLFWRSASIRRLAGLITGLTFERPNSTVSTTGGSNGRTKTARANGTASLVTAGATAVTSAATVTAAAAALSSPSELTRLLRKHSTHQTTIGAGLGLGSGGTKGRAAGVKFTFIIYENQRRWMLLGWTSSLLAYERAAWTDEHNNPVPARTEFELPDVEGGSGMRWRWAPGTRWRVDGVPGDEVDEAGYDSRGGQMGWVYYDNKWQNGRRGADGWGRWTRRRKWYRDAELVEIDLCPPVETKAEPHEVDATLPATDVESLKSRSETSAALRPASPSLSNSGSGGAERSGTTGSSRGDDKAAAGVAEDSVSMLSTSSRAYLPPSLYKRTATTAVTTVTSGSFSSRSWASRRDSELSRPAAELAREAALDDEAAALGLEVSLEMQGRGREAGQWGVGDDAKMGLE